MGKPTKGKMKMAQLRAQQVEHSDRSSSDGSEAEKYKEKSGSGEKVEEFVEEFLYLHCDVPSAYFRITKAENSGLWCYELLCDNEEVYSVERFSNNCLLRAVMYKDTFQIYATPKNDKQYQTWNGVVRLSDETREALLAMGKAVKKHHMSGKVHGRLADLKSYGFRIVFPGKKRTYDNKMEVVLLNGKKQQVGISDEALLKGQMEDLKSLATAYKKVLGMTNATKANTPPYLRGWLKLVNIMGSRKAGTFMWSVTTHPAMWSHVERRRIFEHVWLKRKRVDAIIPAIRNIKNYKDWKKDVPEMGPLRRLLERKTYEDTPFGLFRFIRCVFRHIGDKKKKDVKGTNGKEDGKGENIEGNENKDLGYEYLESEEELHYLNHKFVEMHITQHFPKFLPALYVALQTAQVLP